MCLLYSVCLLVYSAFQRTSVVRLLPWDSISISKLLGGGPNFHSFKESTILLTTSALSFSKITIAFGAGLISVVIKEHTGDNAATHTTPHLVQASLRHGRSRAVSD